MQNICLITPPSEFLLDQRVFPSLGILKIGGVLKQDNRVTVHKIDLSGVKNYPDVIKDYIDLNPTTRHFGITATTPHLPAAVAISTLIRTKRPDSLIILGGPHVTLVSAAQKKEQKLGINRRATAAMKKLEHAFDVLVAGDGEDAIALAQLADSAPKLIDADDPASPLFLTDIRLTELPFPARGLIDLESYRYTIDGVKATSLIAQLGCPFACGFCGGRASPMLRRIRMRTAENIVEEMVMLHREYGYSGFMFYDDELNVNPRMLELMRLIAQTQRDIGVEWRLRGFVKSQLLTDEQADAMYQAGFRWILVGFESGSPSILQAINKKATRDENTRCMDIARRHGLKVKALMSMGHPGESPDTVRETKEWLLQVSPDDFDLTIITCYPGTPYYDDAVPVPGTQNIWKYVYQKTGATLYQVDVDFTETVEYYKGDPNGGYHSYVFTDDLSREDMVALRNGTEREVRRLLDIPFNPSAPAMLYEHSMGQMGFTIPANILRAG